MPRRSGVHPKHFPDHPVLYVVANRSEAVFYEEDHKRSFHFVRRVSNPKGRRSEIDLVSDRQGRLASSSIGPKLRHALEPKLTKHEQNARRFAERIAREIDAVRKTLPIESIVLAAEPHFLGLLRDEMSRATRQLLHHEIHREYSQGSDLETRKKIMNVLKKKTAGKEGRIGARG